MIHKLTIRLAPLAALLALGAAVPGDRWEVTSQMSIEGMPMSLPANKVKVCSPKEWTEPPGAADERRKCVNSDFKKDGSTVTWKMVCAGPPAMTGEGEITWDGGESWAGTVRFAGKDGNMTLKLGGKKLGDCETPQ